MTERRRDLGTRGRVLVAAATVGVAGVLAGWMAATDHRPTSTADDGSTTTVDRDDSSSLGGGDTAVPGSPQSPLTPADARTGGS